MRFAISFGAAAAVLLTAAPRRAVAKDVARWTIEIELDGRTIEGRPLAWSARQVHLLGRDGRLWEFSPSSATKFHKTSSTFSSYAASAMRNQLIRELGRAFEVTSSGHYLVAHPAGERDLWGKRFEKLYRSFVHYFSVRGFRCREPEFPLVAIIFRNQQQFMQYAARDGSPVGRAVLGYYSPTSNRVALFDAGGGRSDDQQWQQNAETIIHEATHQTAFNTGVHNRFAQQPRWAVEGLGTLFEAPGVWDSRAHTRRSDRVNHGRLERFRKYAATGKLRGIVGTMIVSDRLFFTSPDLAYAVAWAFSHWLVETQPRQYSAYLKRVAERPAFEGYSDQQRLADFVAVFGGKLPMIEARFLRFMKTVE